jgi:hypothetical protein
MSVNITQGTETAIKTTTDGGNGDIQHVRIDGGTVALISASAAGTIKGGTLQNLNFGTVDTFYIPVNNFATVVSTGTTTFGTIKATVAGSAIYVTDLVVSAGSATNVEIGDGTVGATNLLGTLQLAQYGGMVANFRIPIQTSVGGTLVYKQSVGCPLTITAFGYVK